ncbi:MAG TPA: tetratricopeptide repeat protein [Lacibacter sp.]|nr:tetratricopeptide repeat protein [Lacibacter sp.]HMO88888.1 tetratricopeptide repeat protein [Lacibacter sp.]HMP86573.1 tetratricopeptide repeat protein [Lacibacter sp.]
MKRRISLAVVALAVVAQVSAQTLEEGKTFMYYERYNSAKDVFQKLVSARPGDAVATYWLGQVYLATEQVAAAKEVYQNGLQANGNNPLLLAGMGQVELLENKITDARNRFETALSLSKNKDLDVLHAVARANVYTKEGDANYAVSKLNLATGLKGFKDASVYITMGDAYRKLVDGGNAVLSYKNALNLNPKLAAARHKEGLIYETQKNREYFMPAFEEAIQLDPNYGPAYYSLYAYWYYRDVAKAEDFLNRYISVIDQDPQNDYFRIDLKYASKQFEQAIQESDALIQKVGVSVIKPRIYRLKAYSFKSLSDFSNARNSADEFFRKAQPEDIVPKDYELYGDILAGTPGSETQAYLYYEKAMNADTSEENKTAYLQKAADLAKALKDKAGMAYWLTKQYNTKKNPNNVDLYNLGRAYFDAGDAEFGYYSKADSIFTIYTERYPTQPYGYYWRGRSNWSIDTSMINGMANPHFEKFVELAKSSADSVSFRPQVKVAYTYFIGYNIFVKKDYPTAIQFCDKILEIDPNDRAANEYKRQLGGNKPQNQPGTTPGSKPAAGNKPAGASAPRR